MHGLLNLNKPAGWSSRDAVNRVQRLVRPAKAGHAGTLDPLATGVLVVCVGHATRLIEYIQQSPKEYEATFLLGRRSPSDDVETEIEELPAAPRPTRAELDAALPQFTGPILQQPPAYSALKVDGRRAYRLARRGEQPDLAPRTVHIHLLAVKQYHYPRLDLHIRCGSGTYIRALGRDLAASLETAAVMTALVRTAVGQFSLADALDPEELDESSIRARLQPPLAAVADLPRRELTPAELVEVRHGRPLPPAVDDPTTILVPDKLAAIDGEGRLVAILRKTSAGSLKPSPNFSQPEPPV